MWSSRWSITEPRRPVRRRRPTGSRSHSRRRKASLPLRRRPSAIRTRWRDERQRQEVRAEVGRRPEEGGRVQVRRFPHCKTRTTCFLGYTKQYGMTKVSFFALGIGLSYTALDKGRCWRRTSSRPTRHWQAVEVHGPCRPEARTGFQNVPPLVKTSVLQRWADVHEDRECRLGEADASPAIAR